MRGDVIVAEFELCMVWSIRSGECTSKLLLVFLRDTVARGLTMPTVASLLSFLTALKALRPEECR